MFAKHNHAERIRRQAPQRQHFTLKKLTVGVASVLIGCTYLGVSQVAQADAMPSNQPTVAQPGNPTPTAVPMTRQQGAMKEVPGSSQPGSQISPRKVAPASQPTAADQGTASAAATPVTSAVPTNPVRAAVKPAYVPPATLSGGSSGGGGGPIGPLIPEGQPNTIHIQIIYLGIPEVSAGGTSYPLNRLQVKLVQRQPLRPIASR